MSTEERTFGDLQIEGKDILLDGLRFDRLATSERGELLLLSLIADTRLIKATRAVFNGGAKATIQASGIEVGRPSESKFGYTQQPGTLYPSQDGYHVSTHKLGYGLAHALFISRVPGFLKVVTSESLWQELNTTRFTTPILRDWISYLESELRREEFLQEALCFNCNCGLLTATSKNLDDVVSKGLKDQAVRIPFPAVA
jgi:hypothetical protein